MLAVTFADLWFRARQFLIAVVGVGLVLALALALSGLADGFHAEVASTVDAVGATSWVMARSAQGRLTAFAAFPAAEVGAVARRARRPPRLCRAVRSRAGGPRRPGRPCRQTVNLFGVQPDGLGDPQVVSGHRLSGADQAVVDSKVRCRSAACSRSAAPLRRGRNGRRPHHGRRGPPRLHDAGGRAAGGDRGEAADHRHRHDGDSGRRACGSRGPLAVGGRHRHRVGS